MTATPNDRPASAAAARNFARTIIRAVAVVAAFVAMAAIFIQSEKSVLAKDEVAFGCDDFGYLRQARLFQQEGTLGGLDTRIDDSATRALIALAQSTGLRERQWDEAIAPHCHHYDLNTKRIVLQYPPGTGWLMSFFTEGLQYRGMTTLVGLLMLGLFAWRLSVVQRSAGLAAIALLGLAALLIFRDFHWSWSVVPSMLLALVAGDICARIFSSRATQAPLWLHALFGLVMGFAVNFRVSNLFLIAGLLVVYSVRLVSRDVRLRVAEGCAFGGAFLTGMTPLLIAQAINAGSVLAPTYNSGDASIPRLDWEQFIKGFQFYLVEKECSAFVLAAAALLLVTLALRAAGRLRAGYVVLIVAVDLVSNMIYFMLHPITTPYYPVPVTMFSFAALSSALALTGNESVRPRTVPARIVAPAFVAMAVIWIGVAGWASQQWSRAAPPTFGKDLPTFAIEPDAIVWGDMSTGSFYYYTNRQAAKLAFTGESERRALVEAVARSGRRQYVVMDTETIRRDIATLGPDFTLIPAGSAFGSDVFRIERR